MNTVSVNHRNVDGINMIKRDLLGYWGWIRGCFMGVSELKGTTLTLGKFIMKKSHSHPDLMKIRPLLLDSDGPINSLPKSVKKLLLSDNDLGSVYESPISDDGFWTSKLQEGNVENVIK